MDLQTYQNDHIDEVEIISLPKKCNKTGAKTDEKAGGKGKCKGPLEHMSLFSKPKKAVKVLYQKVRFMQKTERSRKTA